MPISPVLRSLELEDTLLHVSPHWCLAEGKDHLSHPAGKPSLYNSDLLIAAMLFFQAQGKQNQNQQKPPELTCLSS